MQVHAKRPVSSCGFVGIFRLHCSLITLHDIGGSRHEHHGEYDDESYDAGYHGYSNRSPQYHDADAN